MKSKHSRNDLSALDVKHFRYVVNCFLTRCRQFGYQEIKTSTIEPQYIFTAKNVLSPHTVERMIDFFDKAEGWGGEPVVLRPDSSPCVVRMYNENLYKNPGDVAARHRKYCYVENQFVLTDTKDAITERWQCGVEHLGVAPASSAGCVLADAEVIFMAEDILKQLLPEDTHLFLSYPVILNGLLAKLIPDQTLAFIDAIHARDLSQMKRLLIDVPDGEILLNLISLRGESAEYLKTMKDTLNPSKFQDIIVEFEQFIGVCQYLDQFECSYVIDFSILSDMDYYTGICFQINANESHKQKKEILCAGGRYDHLIGSMYENLYDAEIEAKAGEFASIPATGFGLYIKNILEIIKKRTLTQPEPEVHIRIGNIRRKEMLTAQKLWEQLFQMGFAPRILLIPDEEGEEKASLVFDVNHAKYQDGFTIQKGQHIDKAIFKKMLEMTHV